MNLTEHQRNVLAHVVIDPDKWVSNALSDEHILAKIAKYEQDYLEASKLPDYKNRAQRDASI